MNAVALIAPRRLEVIELPAPRLARETDALLRLERVGVCGSDLHYFETGRIGARVVQFPFVIGHECAGRVLAVGRAVRRVRVGELVAVDPAMACGQCDQCRRGRPHTCRHLSFLGCPGEAAGCLAECLVMPEACLYPATGRLTADQAALCEPLSIGVYAVRLSRMTPGARAVVLGAGPIGLCVLLAARAAGASPLYVTEPVAARARLARELGAAWVGNPAESDVVGGVRALAPGGVDIVFECAGQQSTLDEAVAMLGPGGVLVLVGIPRMDRVSFPIDLLRRKEITLVNVRRQNQCVDAAVALAAAGTLPLDRLVTHHFAADQSQAAFELVAGYGDGVVKAMIDWA